MSYDLRRLIDEIRYVWKISRKPSWEEVKNIVITSLLLAFIIGFIGLIIFILVNLLIG